VTHLRADAIDVKDVDWTRPTAIVLGNEREGMLSSIQDPASISLPQTHSLTVKHVQNSCEFCHCTKAPASRSTCTALHACDLSCTALMRLRQRFSGQPATSRPTTACDVLRTTAGVSQEVLDVADQCAIIPMVSQMTART